MKLIENCIEISNSKNRQRTEKEKMKCTVKNEYGMSSRCNNLKLIRKWKFPDGYSQFDARLFKLSAHFGLKQIPVITISIFLSSSRFPVKLFNVTKVKIEFTQTHQNQHR